MPIPIPSSLPWSRAVLLSGCLLALCAKPLPGQTLHDVVASLTDRQRVVNQREQVEVSLRNQNPDVEPSSSEDLPEDQPINWVGVGTSPTESAVNSLDAGEKIRLLNQAITVFGYLKHLYLNSSAAEFAAGSEVGILKPYTQGDFAPLPRVTPENYHHVLRMLAERVRALNLIEWPAAFMGKSLSDGTIVDEGIAYNDPQDTNGDYNWEPYVKLYPEGINPASFTWKPNSIGTGNLNQSVGQSWPTVRTTFDSSFDISAQYSQVETVYPEIPILRSLRISVTADYPEEARVSATAPGGEGAQIDGTVFILRRSHWNNLNVTGVPPRYGRNPARYKVEGGAGTGAIPLFTQPPQVQVTGTWVTRDVGSEVTFGQTYVEDGYQHKGKLFLSPTDPNYSSSDFDNSYERNWRVGCVFYSVFKPTFTRGVDADTLQLKLESVAAILAENSADGGFLLHPRPGHLFGISLGAGIRGSGGGILTGGCVGTGWNYNSTYSSYYYQAPAFQSFNGWNPMGRIDSSYNLYFAGIASDYHVVYESDRSARLQHMPANGMGWFYTIGFYSGYDNQTLYRAWDSPRIKQVAGRDLIANIEYNAHHYGGYTIKVYRRPIGHPSPTPGQEIPTSGMELIRTWTFTHPTENPTAHPTDAEKLQITGSGGEKFEVRTNHVSPHQINWRSDYWWYEGQWSWTLSLLEGATEKFREDIGMTTIFDNTYGLKTSASLSHAIDGQSVSTLTSDTLNPFSDWFVADWVLAAGDRTIRGTAERYPPGVGEGKWPKRLSIDYDGTAPDLELTWNDNGLLESQTQGPWSTTGTLDGASYKLEHRHNGSRYATNWAEFTDADRKIKFYSAPDGTATGKDHESVAWTEIEYTEQTEEFPGLPETIRHSNGTGATFSRAVNPDGSHSLTRDSGYLAIGAVEVGFRSVSTTNARGFPVSSETSALIGGVALQTGGTTYGDVNAWGAPTKATDFTTGQASTWAYQDNLSRLSSFTDDLGLITEIAGYDVLDRATGSTTNGITASHTFTGLTTTTNYTGQITGSQSSTVDGLGRMTDADSNWNGVATGINLDYTGTNIEATTSHSLLGTHQSTLSKADGALVTASGPTMAFGGTTGTSLEVDGGLLKSRVEIANRPGIFRTTWADAWGRVRAIQEPGAAGGTDGTTITYSPPGDTIQRVLVEDAAGRRSLSEYELATGIRREGIDVDGNGIFGSGDHYTTTTPSIVAGKLESKTLVTGESAPLAESTYNPVNGETITKTAGGGATLTTGINWTTKKITTGSSDGWTSETEFNTLGLATTGEISGDGIPTIATERPLRADGSIEAVSSDVGGEITSAEFAPNGLLTGYTDPVLGNRGASHSITPSANGIAETLSIGGISPETRTTITTEASDEGTSSTLSGPNLFAREVSTEIEGGALKTTIDPTGDGASTTLTLNDAGLKTEHGYADGFKPVITWRPGGLPVSISTGIGNIGFSYSEDGAMDLLGIGFPTSGPNAGSGQIGFTYDAAGRIATLTDDTGTRTYGWSLGHPVSETWDTGPVIERALDGQRRLQNTVVKDGNTPILTTTPGYTGDSRELASISADGFTATFIRDANTHRIIGITRGTVIQTFGRGTGGRITSAYSNVAGAPSFGYPDNTHDGQGRRTKAVTNRGDWDYEYRGGVNGDGQLAEADHTGPGDWDFEYETDGIGRRLSVKSPASNGNTLTTGNEDAPLNQFLSTQWYQQRILRASLARGADATITESYAGPSFSPGLEADPEAPPLRDIVHALTSPGSGGGWTIWSITGTLEGGGDPGAAQDRKAKLTGLVWFPPTEESFEYDDAGNRISSARWLYTYDGLNRLTRAVNKGIDAGTNEPEAWDVRFTYDAEGRRHRKTAMRYSGGDLKETTITTWIWDGWHPVIERVSDGNSNNTLTERKLVWGPDLSGQPGGAGGAGGLLLIRETTHSGDGRPPVTTDLLPLYDGSGNIVGLANPAGDLLAEYWYGPFGELLESSGPNADTNPWRWASKSLDAETGLVYFGLRYYDPSTGQWLSREPLGEGESLNLYAYCHNDPINRVDVIGADELTFLQALSTLENSPQFQGLFTQSWTGAALTPGFPNSGNAWTSWEGLLQPMLNALAGGHFGDSEEEKSRRYGAVRSATSAYRSSFAAAIEQYQADANAVRMHISANSDYWAQAYGMKLKEFFLSNAHTVFTGTEWRRGYMGHGTVETTGFGYGKAMFFFQADLVGLGALKTVKPLGAFGRGGILADDVFEVPMILREGDSIRGPAGAGFRYEGFPGQMIVQPTANTCGPACGYQLLRETEGVSVHLSNLTRNWYKGLEPADLAANMNHFGSGWTGGFLEGTARELSALSARGSFVARIGGWSTAQGRHLPGHFVIVDRVADGKVFLRDPAGGVGRTLTEADFLEIFTGAVWKK